MENALEIHAHYSKLFEAFAKLPSDDIGLELFMQVCYLWADCTWNEFGKFLERVEAYTEVTELSPGRRDEIAAFLDKQKSHYERGIWMPETRPEGNNTYEHDLKRRRRELDRGIFYPEFDEIKLEDSFDIKANYLNDVKQEIDRRLQLISARKATQPLSASPTPPAKRGPATDVRRYFPAVAATLGDSPTDESALANLAIWLLGWAERHASQPESSPYSLAGQLREQQAAHSDAGKFLKACRRLHKELLPLAATEQTTKALLGSRCGPHSRQNLQAVLTWWAGRLREAHHDPAGAYLAALKRVPILKEEVDNSPRYTLPMELLDADDFSADIAPLRQAFEDALLNLSKGEKRALRGEFVTLLAVDLEGIKRRKQQHERGEYALSFLPADFPGLHFDVAGQPGGFSLEWVSPVFWGDLGILLRYKQEQARAAFEKLNAVLGDSLPVLPKRSSPLDTLAPQPEATAASACPFSRLLLNYSLTALTVLLSELGLFDAATGRPTPAASPGAWVGVVHGLLDAPLPRLRRNMAATRRALEAVFRARVSESLLQAGVSKRGSESEQFRDRTLALLAAPAARD